MSAIYLTGTSGRLGTVIAETLRLRGDTFVGGGMACNYMIFAHRYRKTVAYAHSFAEEMRVNVENVADAIEHSVWADGDRAIVIVSSINATEPELNQSLGYNLSKAALNNMARYYAKLQPVRINTVSPATFTGDNPQVSKQEVANVIAFLCSAEASGINGQDIRVTQ